MKIGTILHPTDFSEPSDEAFRMACALARERDAYLIVLHVTEKPVVSYIEKASELPAEQLREKLWQAIRWPRDEETGINIEHRIEEGDAVQQILRVAQERQCDLIIMGTRGRGGPARWFTGSVTESVVRKAPCSVLVAK